MQSSFAFLYNVFVDLIRASKQKRWFQHTCLRAESAGDRSSTPQSKFNFPWCNSMLSSSSKASLARVNLGMVWDESSLTLVEFSVRIFSHPSTYSTFFNSFICSCDRPSPWLSSSSEPRSATTQMTLPPTTLESPDWEHSTIPSSKLQRESLMSIKLCQIMC